MSNKIGVIGIGACGNQIVGLAAEEGFKCLAINTADIDMEDIKSNKFDKMIIGHEGGSGQERSIAKMLVQESYVKMTKDIFQSFSEMDMIYICGSSGGGSASGMMPSLLKVLIKAMPDNKFGNIVIMPSMNESLRRQSNTVEYWGEISKLNIPIIAYDNGKVNSKDLSEIFDKVNATIIEDLKIMRGDYTTKASRYGNIDDKDMLKLMTTNGLMSISKLFNIRENDLDNSSLSALIIDSIKSNYCVDFDRDKIVKRMGFILSLPKTMTSKHDSTYALNKEYVGEPIEVFEHLNINDVDVPGHVITICSGLSHPEARLSEIARLAKSKKENVTISKVSNIDTIKTSTDWIKSDLSISDLRKKESKKLDMDINFNFSFDD